MPQLNLSNIIDNRAQDDQTWLTEIGVDGVQRGVTYGQVRKWTGRLAGGLLRRGLNPGARVGIAGENSADYLIAYLAIMRAGCCAVPINIKFPKETIEHVFRDSEIDLTFSATDYRTLLPTTGDCIELGGSEWKTLLEGGVQPARDMLPDDFANILYTSGSTGLPKGVPLTHGGYVWAVQSKVKVAPEMATARVLIAAPLYHMNALFFSKMASQSGAHQVVLKRFSAERYLRAIVDCNCNYLTSVPTMLALIAREHELLSTLDFSHVDTVVTGSAPSTDTFFQRLQEIFPNAEFGNSYGTTESSPVAFGPHPDGIPKPLLALGYASPDAELRLVGGLSPNEGELHIRNQALMPGYLNQPDKTRQKLVDGWYLTGDTMRKDKDGFYYFVGRVDDMFICGGENIYPGEIEKILESHEAVSQAIVVPLADDIKGQIPVAFVVRDPNASFDEEQAKQFVLSKAPPYMHPRFVRFVDTVPLAGTNKVDRAQLLADAAALFAGKR